jgi:hypothetical protein
MKVMIAGGSGLIGSALTKSLLNDGHTVYILTRKPRIATLPHGAQPLAWDGRTTQGWLGTFRDMDAVVNLAGSTVGAWPWSAERKREILESRVTAGQSFVRAFEQCKAVRHPKVFIQASGVGYYGPRGEEPVSEEMPAGDDFLAEVAVNWEGSTRLLDSLGVRRVVIRTSLVLDRHGGVLPLMALPVAFFAGGPLGDGKQGISWIHLRDEVRAIRFLMTNDKAFGVFNLSAPNPLSNADFLRALAGVLRRPYWLSAPSWALRLALGEMSALLLAGQYVLPQRLAHLGFVFDFQSVVEAFTEIYGE